MLGSSSATRIFLLMRQREGKAGAAPSFTLHPHATAEVLDDLAADMQPKAAPLGLAGQRVAGLAELVEDHSLIDGVDAGPVVAHLDAQRPALLLQRNADLARSRL